MNHRLNGEKTAKGKKATTVSNCNMHILGGHTLTLEEYSAYIQALSVKPFLTVQEASIYFNIGVNKVYRMMKHPKAEFVLNNGSRKQYSRIHREGFEKWLLTYGEEIGEEV